MEWIIQNWGLIIGVLGGVIGVLTLVAAKTKNTVDDKVAEVGKEVVNVLSQIDVSKLENKSST